MRAIDTYNNDFVAKEDDTLSGWIPHVFEETCTGGRVVELRSKHLANRKILLNGEVCDRMADDFVSVMLYLTAESDEPIDIYINSPGGSVSAGLVIYDIIKAFEGKCVINMYCCGLAASMGAIIFSSGQKGRRFILPHSRVMIHEPSISNGMHGKTTSVLKTAEELVATKKILNEILAANTGKTVEEIDDATTFDNYMSAEEAIEFGLCDRISGII